MIKISFGASSFIAALSECNNEYEEILLKANDAKESVIEWKEYRH